MKYARSHREGLVKSDEGRNNGAIHLEHLAHHLESFFIRLGVLVHHHLEQEQFLLEEQDPDAVHLSG